MWMTLCRKHGDSLGMGEGGLAGLLWPQVVRAFAVLSFLQLSTVETSLLMRLSTLPGRCGTAL